MEVSRDRGVPLLARGAGTSLAGQTVARALVLDLSRHMDRIVEIDPKARTARVQPGVVQDDLNRAAQHHGLMFGADTSTSNRATLGGMIGNNSSGSHSVRFGMTLRSRAGPRGGARRRPACAPRAGRRSGVGPPGESDHAGGRRLPGAAGDRRAEPRGDRARPPAVLAPGRGATGSTGWPEMVRRSTWPSSSSAPRGRWWSSPRPTSIWWRAPPHRRSRSGTSARPPRRSPPAPTRSPTMPLPSS